MATTPIKQLGHDANMTPRQMHRERDLIDQLNRALNERDTERALFSSLFSIARPICYGRITTAAGAITTNMTRGCTVTLTGTNQRVTFDEPQPLGADGTPSYSPFAMALTANPRIYTVTNYQSAFFDFRLFTDTGANVDPAVTAIAMTFVVFS